jgi:hypothetical protein
MNATLEELMFIPVNIDPKPKSMKVYSARSRRRDFPRRGHSVPIMHLTKRTMEMPRLQAWSKGVLQLEKMAIVTEENVRQLQADKIKMFEYNELGWFLRSVRITSPTGRWVSRVGRVIGHVSRSKSWGILWAPDFSLS